MTGELHIKNEDGTDGGVVPGLEPISKEFTPRSKSGDVTIEAEIPAELLNGKTVVAFETCYEDGVALVIHADINDEDQTQTIKEPEIHTTATNKDTGTHSLPANNPKVTVQDKVVYSGLVPGRSYTITGELHERTADGKDGGVLKDANGNPYIKTSSPFTPENSEGFVMMDFEVDATLLQGKTIVVFETLYRNGKEVYVHADINDEEQTVVVSDFGTSAATDKGEKSFPATETVTIVDTVTYSGLEIGHEYAVCGTIHTRVSDDVSLEITDGGVFAPAGQKCVNFTPTEGAGTVDVVFTFPGEELVSNQQLTVFEELFNASDIVDGKPKDGVTPLKEHKDITDDDQTVTVTKALKRIKTTAKGNKNGSVLAGSKKAVITDTIAYTGFESGKTYKFCGTLHKRGGTEGAYTDAGTIAPLNGAEANKDYVCSDAVEIKDVEKESGTVDVKFEFDASSLKKGDAIVVFERAYELDEKGEIPGGAGSDNHVARHEDINDKGQTVDVVSPTIPPEEPTRGGGEDKPKSTPTPTSEQYITCQTLGYPAGYYWDASKQECVSIRHTNTGAENGIVWYVVGGVAVCAALAFVLYKKKKDSENNQETKKD
jgi:LPXTG-motif cell wall-anchored protein